MKKVSVITVNFNHNYVTDALLRSIAEKNMYAPLEIIVVDNGSNDNPVPAWRKKYPHVNFIRSDKNLGFAGGNNLGIKAATGDYLFLVNNDTEFTKGLLEALINTLELNPECGIVSPKIRYFDVPNMLQYAGFTNMNYFTCRNKCIGQFAEDKGQYDSLSGITGFAHGAAMMVRRTAMEKAGMMAENFFLYYEEMDWCEMIKRAGFTIRLNMQALIYHKESVSTGKTSALKEFFMNRNRILFIRRNAPGFKKLFFYGYFILFVTPRNVIRYVKKKQYSFIPVLFKAIAWNIAHKKDNMETGYPISN